MASGFTIPERVAMTRVSHVAIKNIARSFQAHILNLSMDFFRAERSTDLLAAVEDGEAVSELIEQVILDVVPTLADVLIAMIYLYYTINGYVALAILLPSATYCLVAYYGETWVSETSRDFFQKRR
ncbi:hypothetical protein AYL99_12034 [Fonsecaea erecta]|uniref:ABC transmembrane type-1 domain-containing protein n=1 Tax=Fonsecaea erecta TaxID=1367422 RepID=A0A178Z1U8_9EURO|nr:hypothetical protein AYL99_12034 [Fonsecaea erecta]OAP53768.1 hypothetical protein AYL99_12034 [Fonsecaea erecta]